MWQLVCHFFANKNLLCLVIIAKKVYNITYNIHWKEVDKLATKLKIIPLGGVGEIGKNITLIECGDDIIAIDCGIIFPDDEMPGIDLVIPDFTYIEKNIEKFRGFLITHGHEDHIGALPYALKKFNVPVYGSKLTIALIEHKIQENKISKCSLNCVSAGDVINIGCFNIEFIRTSHSIPGALALAITTPLGTIIHTGDFKVDYTPIDGEPMDIARFSYYGSKGVLALMSDSTNVELQGHTPSEIAIGKTFEHYFDIATGRIIVASFASNIYRIQQIADVAAQFDRVICFQGRSMVNIVNIARELGYLNIDDSRIVDIEKLENYKEDEICVVTTGSQGEPMSGLFRMANSSHKLNIGKGDTVIISASTIPGNERGVARVINQLYQKGARVIYDSTADVHVSGHARREELKLMLTIVKPKYFIPVHGEYRHLYQHAELAERMGVKRENIFVTENGKVVEFSKNGAKFNGSVPWGSIMIDGIGVGDIGNVVLKDRITLSHDGLFAVVIALRKDNGEVIAEPEVLSRGFVYVKESEELIKGAIDVARNVSKQFALVQKSEWSQVKTILKTELKDYLYDKTKRNPMVLPIIVEI